MDWTKTYPALATVMVASFETLCTWHDNLPAPQTDVERTVYRRLLARRDELLRQQVRERAPDIAAKFNDIIDKLGRVRMPPGAHVLGPLHQRMPAPSFAFVGKLLAHLECSSQSLPSKPAFRLRAAATLAGRHIGSS